MSDARELFNQLMADRRELRSVRLLIESLRADSGYHSMDYSLDRVQTSPTSETAAEKVVARILELEEKERLVQESYRAHLVKATVVVEKLGGLRGEYLARRYIKGQTTREIAEELHYSEGYLLHVGVDAMNEIDGRGLCC